MKILKLLNKKNFSIIFISLLSYVSTSAEDKPADIWNIDKKKVKESIEGKSSVEKIEEISESNIYQLQTDKNIDSISFDKELTSKKIEIVGLYDPEDYGLSIDMWSNTDGSILKKLLIL